MGTTFLDRDGVINRKPPEGDYVKSWEEFEFLPHVPEAIAQLKQRGFRVIVTTNQRGVSLGRVPEETLRAMHQRMRAELLKAGAVLDAIYYCPHDHHTCTCRKPEVGLFLQAKRDFPEIDFPKSLVVGDSIADMEAAARLGAKSILIGNSAGVLTAVSAEKHVRVDLMAPSLSAAAEEILRLPGAWKPERLARASSQR